MTDAVEQEISAEAYIGRLAERGIEYVFANPGTDFAPIIEAISRNAGGNRKFPRFVTVPHENVAMAMAHGYYRVSGKMAAVMCHVTVGTANTICGLMNAARDGIPVLLAAGRTPITDTGHIASRNRGIHWGQESFDQGGMLREYVKWDTELRAGQPVASVVDRALDIAMTEPRGPVYLTLPREVLADPSVPQRRTEMRPLGATAPSPDADAMREAAKLIAGAAFPLIIASRTGRSKAAFDALAALALEFALPVLQIEATDLSLPTDHPMQLGFDPGKLLPRADVVLVLDAAVPWVPRAVSPKQGAKLIHLAPDPLQSRYPYREYEADLLITGTSAAGLPMLINALRDTKAPNVEARRQEIAKLRAEMLKARADAVEKTRHLDPVSPTLIAAMLNELKAPDAVIINELGLPVGQIDMTAHGSYMGGQLAGGLGFGLGAALGAKLADPKREVILTVGDGSYMFGNPTPAHFVAKAEGLATLTIIFNNKVWQAVRGSTTDVYPHGVAAKANVMPLVDLKPSPDYEKIVEACGGLGIKVERPEQLRDALVRGLAAVRAGTPTVINVFTQPR